MSHLQIPKNKEQEKQKTPSGIHPSITVTIPERQAQVANPESQTPSVRQSIYSLPVESARLVTVGSKKKKLSHESKFIPSYSMKNLSRILSVSKVGKLRNVVYRNKIDKVISQQKTRIEKLEQTMMFQRQRRFNKAQNAKKYQRLGSPSPKVDKNMRKFKRTDDKKQEEDKKFKRNKQQQGQDEQNQRLLQAKLIRKLREDPNMQLISLIPQQLGQYTDSALISSNVVESEIMQNSSEGNKNEPKEGTAETQVFIENNEAVIETPQISKKSSDHQ